MMVNRVAERFGRKGRWYRGVLRHHREHDGGMKGKVSRTSVVRSLGETVKEIAKTSIKFRKTCKTYFNL